MRKNCLIIFSKTPGLSPVKTRLQREHDERFVNALYAQFIQILENKFPRESEDRGFDVLWAVAEKKAFGEAIWEKKECVLQEGESLGERLSNVFERARQEYGKILFAGADMPQIQPATIQRALNVLEEQDAVIGPSIDGGFYLLGMKNNFPRQVLEKTPYSSDVTFSKLCENIKAKKLSMGFLEKGFDVDCNVDLERLRTYYQCTHYRFLTKDERELLFFLSEYERKRCEYYYSGLKRREITSFGS